MSKKIGGETPSKYHLVQWVSIIFVAVVSFLGIWILLTWKAVPYFLGYVCGEILSCESSEKVADVFSGVNSIFSCLAFMGVLISLELSRRSSLEDKRKYKEQREKDEIKIEHEKEKEKENRERSNDKEVLEQIGRAYSWAYNSLADTLGSEVRGERLAWMTCARHLLRAKALSDKLETDTYIIIQEDQEEYWRTRFYTLIDGDQLYVNTDDNLKRPEGEGICPRSIAVIGDFIAWPTEVKDPLDAVDVDSIFESGSLRVIPNREWFLANAKRKEGR